MELVKILELSTKQNQALKKYLGEQTDKAFFKWYLKQKNNSEKFNKILLESKFKEGNDLTLEQLYEISKLLTSELGNTALSIIGEKSIFEQNQLVLVNSRLRDLLFGTSAISNRVNNFVFLKGVGAMTASQFLCLFNHEKYPFFAGYMKTVFNQKLFFDGEQYTDARKQAFEEFLDSKEEYSYATQEYFTYFVILRKIKQQLNFESYLQLQNLLWRIYNPEDSLQIISNHNVKETTNNWWVEKRIISGTRKNNFAVGKYAFPNALWTPQKDAKGRDIYRNMRTVKKDDIIIHLVDNEKIVGISKVSNKFENDVYEDFRGKRFGYRVDLIDYQELTSPISRNEIFNQKHAEQLLKILNKGHYLFYNVELNLNQGAYLTEAPHNLVQVINKIYNEKTGKNLPYYTSEVKSEIRFSEALTNFVEKFKKDPENKVWIKKKDKAFTKWQKKFESNELESLTEEDFKIFLTFTENQSWDGIQRHSSVYANMDDLRRTLVFLLDRINEVSYKEIQQRLDEILPKNGKYKIKGLGRAIITAIIHIADKNNRFGVWNKKVDDAVKKMGLHIDVATKSMGEKYLAYNSILTQFGKEFNLDLREVDLLMHKIVTEFSIQDNQKINDYLTRPSEEDIQNAILKIQEQLLVDELSIREIVTHLVAGKNVIICGPIGTGKTHLATMIPEQIWKEIGGYYPAVYTATGDWTTQDVIGGIVPKLNENQKITYQINKGCVYETVSKNIRTDEHHQCRCFYKRGAKEYHGVWLIVDEFNRANIDKAFGEMFTAIEHHTLKVPTMSEKKAYSEITIPNDFRIIGTLNTFDKHYLFKLSGALKRRFAFVEILPPKRDQSRKEKFYALKRSLDALSSVIDKEKQKEITEFMNFDKKTIENKNEESQFIKMIDIAYDIVSFIRYSKNLGTAILISIYSYLLVDNQLEAADFEKSLDIALKSYVIPHLENIPQWGLESIRAFCLATIGSFFKGRKQSDVNFDNYMKEFENLLNYLGEKNITETSDNYRKGVIKEENWSKYDPWVNKTCPNLPRFESALNQLISELEFL